MAKNLLRRAISWVSELFQPPMIALTLVLLVLFTVGIVNVIARYLI